jgi:hypothetical protein
MTHLAVLLAKRSWDQSRPLESTPTQIVVARTTRRRSAVTD